jgi:hypothetical protein
VKGLLGKALLFSGAAGFTGGFINKRCHKVYQCGCTFIWAGYADPSKIHKAPPPHCPRCAHADFATIAFVSTIGAQAFVSFWPGPLKWLRVIAALAASPVTAAITGWLIGMYVGYWS